MVYLTFFYNISPMVLKEYTTDFCNLSIYDRYAIFKMFENSILDNEHFTFVSKKLKKHYNNNPFVLIADRTFHYKIDFSVYKKRNLKNIKGYAIVSTKEEEKDRALKEQPFFKNSFALFENLDDAQSWAESFF